MITGWFKRKDLKLLSPFTGLVRSLDDVPDQVFSSRMAGDGVAVEPWEGIVLSPVEGVIEVLFPTGHAFGIRTSEGVEVLVHVGIDTVNLNGEGFQALKRQGDRVLAGELVIRFDLETIRSKAPSSLSPVIMTTAHQFQVLRHGQVKAGEDLMSYRL